MDENIDKFTILCTISVIGNLILGWSMTANNKMKFRSMSYDQKKFFYISSMTALSIYELWLSWPFV